MGKKKHKTLQVICNKCKQETYHQVVKEQIEHKEFLDWDIWVNENRQIIKCKWCWSLSFREESLCSEDIWIAWNECIEDVKIEIFPKRSANSITKKQLRHTPIILKKIYDEIITTYNENCYILAVIWIRSLLEWICKEEKIKWNDLSQKIKSLVNKGIITQNISEVLHDIRKLWNEVTHELKELNWFEIKHMIEIMENIIENIYELPNKSKKVIENKQNR